METVNPPNPQTLGRRATTGRTLGIAAAVIVVAIGWYLFRPELPFISRSVNETFPTTATEPTTTSNPVPMLLSQGRFHGVAHATEGLATIYRLLDGQRALRLTEFETSNGYSHRGADS